MRQDVASTIKGMLVSELFVEVPEEHIDVDDGLQSVVGLDSVGFIELRVLCEREFRVQISDDDFRPDNFRSVRVLADLIERLQTAQAGSDGIRST